MTGQNPGEKTKNMRAVKERKLEMKEKWVYVKSTVG